MVVAGSDESPAPLATVTPPVVVPPVVTPPVVVPPPVEVKMSLNSNVMVDGGKMPLEHYCKADGGLGLIPPLSWKDYPKNTAGFVLFATMTQEGYTQADKPETFYTMLSTNKIPVTTTSISTGEDISKTNVGTFWGYTSGMNVGWQPYCKGLGQDYMKFTVYAVDDTFPVLTQKKLLYWTEAKFKDTYKTSILSSASLNIKL